MPFVPIKLQVLCHPKSKHTPEIMANFGYFNSHINIKKTLAKNSHGKASPKIAKIGQIAGETNGDTYENSVNNTIIILKPMMYFLVGFKFELPFTRLK